MPTTKGERVPTNANLQIPIIVFITFLSIVGLAVRPLLLRKLVFTTILLLSYFWLWGTQSDNLVGDYSLGLWVATNVFCLSDFVGLCDDVQRDVVRKTKKKVTSGQNGSRGDYGSLKEEKSEKEEIWTRPLSERLVWAFELWTAKRGVGWEHEVPGLRIQSTSTSPSLRAPRPKTLLGFFLTRAIQLAECGLLYFIGDVLMQMNPSFQTHGPAFAEQVWWFRPTVLGHVLAARGGINGTYVVGSVVWVVGRIFLGAIRGKGRNKIEDLADEWPPLFGSFLEAWSVRNVWRRVWHQMMRRFLLTHGAFVADVFNARSKHLRALINLYTAFLISATIHYLGDYAVLKDWTGGSMVFFMLQPVAITFEILVLRIFRATGIRVPGWLAKTLGYTWVLVWFTVTLSMWVEPLVRAGFMEDGWHGPVVLWCAQKLRPAAAKWE
ncbi:hypothetical protein MD484_g490, partial [Candolleomyces efflorescens]